MRIRTWLIVAAASIALTLSTLPAASASPIPDDLEFSYELDTPILGMPNAFATAGSCTQTLGPTFALLMNGQPEPELSPALANPGNNVRCTMESSADSSGVTMQGSVSASASGESGSGRFTLVCDIGRSMSSWFNVIVSGAGDPALAADPYGVTGRGHVSCSWTIEVDDEQKSQLSGTLEMAGAFSLDSTPVDWSNCAALGLPIPERVLPRAKCVTFDMEISAFLTGATGAYAGRTGSGTLTQALFIPVVIPIDLSSPPPPDPGCPPEQPDCKPLDLTGCEYSPTDPGDPMWNNLSDLPPAAGAGIPGWQGPGWYRCAGDDAGGGGGGEGLSRCQYSPTEQTDPGWSYIELPPGAAVPGYQGPGWYNCGDVPPPPPPEPAAISTWAWDAVMGSVLTPRSVGDLLSLSTQSGKVSAPRIVAPARVADTTVRPFVIASKTTVRLSTVPGATCAVTAKAGKTTVKLASAKGISGRIDTKTTASQLMSRLKVTKSAQATITATCSVKTGKKLRTLPPTTVTVKFV